MERDSRPVAWGIGEPVRWGDSAVGGFPDLRRLSSAMPDLKQLASLGIENRQGRQGRGGDKGETCNNSPLSPLLSMPAYLRRAVLATDSLLSYKVTGFKFPKYWRSHYLEKSTFKIAKLMKGVDGNILVGILI
ncbi:MAG: hypothetical protein V7K89_02720 [Nostoc sp.]|uniref:hypothetical protein n=1 Tax=Nostoc sp. TaxID=1180 RepID=UPI002FF9FA03